MNILSLFDGMSCGRIALDRLGIKVDKYYASEIDKYTMQVAKANYPDTIHIGSVVDVKAAELEEIDLLIGGSPCQGFSFAGKQLNFDDPRSALFFEFVRLLKECREINPNVFFLLENVKMKKEYQDVITEHLGVEPIEINSALVSAQNRKRLYWTNIPGVQQPEDRGIFLKDILEIEVDEKYYLSDEIVAKFNIHNWTGQTGCINNRGNLDIRNEKSMCIDANYHKGMDNHGQRTHICVASRGRNPENPTSREAGLPTEQMLEPRFDGKTNCLTTVGKDNLVMQLNPSTESNGCQPYQQNRVYDTAGKSPCLMAQMSCGSHAVLEEPQFRIRRLTPIECERLQTVPDNYTAVVSNTQRYRMLGNGWTIDIIAHILDNISILFK